MMLPKAKIIRDRKYLDFLRTQPCVITGRGGTEYETVDPAHLRFGVDCGTGMKPPDNHALPLGHFLHEKQHQQGEIWFWLNHIQHDLLREALIALAEKRYMLWKEGR